MLVGPHKQQQRAERWVCAQNHSADAQSGPQVSRTQRTLCREELAQGYGGLLVLEGRCRPVTKANA